jgi:hypothetical protein
MVTVDAVARAAATWLEKQKCEVVRANGAVSHCDVVTWRKTLASFGITSVKASVSPHSVPWGFAKTALVNGNRVHVNARRLEDALSVYTEMSAVLGVKLSRLTQGNTRLTAFVPADDLTPQEIRSLLDLWIENVGRLQAIGRSPGQTLGEVTVSLYTLGLTGFRVQQPVEIYPILLFSDATRFDHARAALIADSVRETCHHRESVARFVLPRAPAFLQAILVCLPTRTVAADDAARETRRAWRHYKKPKLASRVFAAADLERLLTPGA